VEGVEIYSKIKIFWRGRRVTEIC